MKQVIAGALLLSCLLAGCTTAPSDTSLTKTTSRLLPEREVARRVTAQLTDVLLPKKHPAPNPDARSPLFGLTYDMAARPALSAAGVCLQSYTSFAFEPSGPREGADTRVRVSSVSTHFQLIVPEKQDAYDGVPADDHDQARKLCERTAPAYARFDTDDEYAGIAALKAFEALQTALATQPDFPLDCEDYPSALTDCRADLSRLIAANISEAKSCGRDRQKPRPNQCHMLWISNYEVQIFVDPAGVAQYALADELIFLAHPRAD